eukprot:855413-Amphidinium_carterae.2
MGASACQSVCVAQAHTMSELLRCQVCCHNTLNGNKCTIIPVGSDSSQTHESVWVVHIVQWHYP